MNTDPHSSQEMNVDPGEINKFGELAATWWDKEGAFRSLHQINPLRLQFIQQQTPPEGKTVLDIGCGGGIFSETLAAHGATVTGIDMAEASLNVARLHALENEIEVTYRQITAEQLAAECPRHWDIVTCLELLEHVPDPASIVAACSQLVKPGGAVYFSTLNRNLKSFFQAIVGAEYVLGILPRGTHQYEKFIRPSELHRWCEACDLETIRASGIHYNPLFKTYRLADGIDVNYLVYTVKSTDQ